MQLRPGFPKFSATMRAVSDAATRLGEQRPDRSVRREDFLAALDAHETPVAHGALRLAGIANAADLRRAASADDEALSDLPLPDAYRLGPAVRLSDPSKAILLYAVMDAGARDSDVIDSGDLLLAIARESGVADDEYVRLEQFVVQARHTVTEEV